jgi:DNA repair protein RadA/Sms
MSKIKSKFVCQECGYESIRWLGKCPGCDSWNSMEEELTGVKVEFKRSPTIVNQSKPQPIKNVKSGAYERYDTQIGELNRVLGGGLVKGSLILVSGEPGIGKSTLILQVGSAVADKYGRTLYVSGEESEEQIKMRGEYNRRKKEMKPFIPSLISKYEEHEVNLTAGGGNGCNCDNGICPVR